MLDTTGAKAASDFLFEGAADTCIGEKDIAIAATFGSQSFSFGEFVG